MVDPTSNDRSAQRPPGQDADAPDPPNGDVRRELAIKTEREERLMRLLNANNPDRLEHDLRNVLNELSLLRALFAAEQDIAPRPKAGATGAAGSSGVAR